jgi:hypothetical protein
MSSWLKFACAAVLVVAVGTTSPHAAPKLEEDFTTLADMYYFPAFTKKKDFRWYVQKRFIERIVRRVLLVRGFEEYSATYIARTWDGWRYHPETGERLYPGQALALSPAQAVAFAYAVPDCLKDITTSTCQVTHSIELGCRYEPHLVKICRQNFEKLQKVFPALFAPDPHREATHPFTLTEFYEGTSCFQESGKGADLVVFAPNDIEVATKLVFEAVRKADAVVAAAPAAPPPAPPAIVAAAPAAPAASAAAPPATKPHARLCSALGKTDPPNDLHALAGLFKVFGRETEMVVPSAAGFDGTLKSRFQSWVEDRRQKKRPVPAAMLEQARSLGLR